MKNIPINKKLNKLIVVFLTLFLLQSCGRNKYLILNNAEGIEMINLTDFTLNNVYFEEELCKESQSFFCITKDNAEKYMKNIIILRKALNERNEKFKLI